MQIITLLSLIAGLILSIYSDSFGQYYYLNTYENPHGSNPESISVDYYTKSINLDSALVEDSVKLLDDGYFAFKKPITLDLNNHQILVSFVQKDPNVLYAIIRSNNGMLSIIRQDSIARATVFYRQYHGENGFRLGLWRNGDTTSILRSGLYGLNNSYNFRFSRFINIWDNPGLIHNIGTYEELTKVPFDSAYNLYYTIQDSQWWLVKLNSELNAVVDSIPLMPSGGAATLFGFNPLRNKFYCLHTNYEMHTNTASGDSAYKRREDYYINPDVWIIDPVTLDILEQYPITDYPNGNYPGQENGLADVVGDYIVYYFFIPDDRNRFDPAMLFIFDTRTNEATWLRVGWR
jgi:hypothetical protein